MRRGSSLADLERLCRFCRFSRIARRISAGQFGCVTDLLAGCGSIRGGMRPTLGPVGGRTMDGHMGILAS